MQCQILCLQNTAIAHSLLAAHPFLILLPLALDVPKSSSSLTLPADPAVESQESIRVSFAKDRFSFSCVFTLWTPAVSGDLTCPLGALDWLQFVGRYDDASGKQENASEELESDIERERGVGER